MKTLITSSLTLLLATGAMAASSSAPQEDLRLQVERSFLELTLTDSDAVIEHYASDERVVKAVGSLGATMSSAGVSIAGATFGSALSIDQLNKIAAMPKDVRSQPKLLAPKLFHAGVGGAITYVGMKSADGSVRNSSANFKETKETPAYLLNDGNVERAAQSAAKTIGAALQFTPAEQSAYFDAVKKALDEKKAAGDAKQVNLAKILFEARFYGRPLLTSVEAERLTKLLETPVNEVETTKDWSEKDQLLYLMVATAKLKAARELLAAQWTPARKAKVDQTIEQNVALLKHTSAVAKAKGQPAVGEVSGEAERVNVPKASSAQDNFYPTNSDAK